MKTIEERAVQYEEISGCYGCQLGQVKEAFIAGAKSEHECLTRWNSPECPPDDDRDVLLKIESCDGGIFYAVGFYESSGEFLQNVFVAETNIYPPQKPILGWREIHEQTL